MDDYNAGKLVDIGEFEKEVKAERESFSCDAHRIWKRLNGHGAPLTESLAVAYIEHSLLEVVLEYKKKIREKDMEIEVLKRANLILEKANAAR